MIAALSRALTMMDEKTNVLPREGPLSTRADRGASRAILQAVRDRVAELIARGLGRAAVWPGHPISRFDAVSGGGFLKPDVFVGIVYDSLAAGLR